MAEDKGKGKETKPPSEIKVAAQILDDAVEAKKAEAKDVPTFQLSKKEDLSPSAKNQSGCKSHQTFGATKLGSHLATYIMCA